MEPATITEPVILFNLNQRYRRGMSGTALYDVTRGVWKIGERRSQAEFALAVAGGEVVEVYKIQRWHPAASTPYLSGRKDQFNPHYAGRWEFTGDVAPPAIRAKYLGLSVGHYFGGAQNPVRYVNV